MIIKAKKNNDKEAISLNQIYFVIKYKINNSNGEEMFCIFDDCRTLSWINADCFFVENDSLNNYDQEIDDDTICYVYNRLDNNFYVDFYQENDVSVNAIIKLEKIIVNVIAEELSAEAILNNLNELGFHGMHVEIQIKAFFKMASYENIINFVNSIYNNFSNLDEYLYKIIVENIIPYKGTEIDNLLSEIIMSPLCSEDVKDQISDYWL